MRRAGLADPGQVAFHVGHEYRHAVIGKALRKNLQGNRLAGAGGAGDETVPVGPFQNEVLGRGPFAQINFALFVHPGCRVHE